MLTSCFRCDLCNDIIEDGVAISGDIQAIRDGVIETLFPIPSCQHICAHCLDNAITGDTTDTGDESSDDED